MSQPRFLLSIGLLAVLLLLCGMPFFGPIIGFMAGITLAFFVAPAGYLAQFVLTRFGIALSVEQVSLGMLALGAVMILGIASSALLAWRRGQGDAARRQAFAAALVVTLPLGGWISLEALAKAWP